MSQTHKSIILKLVCFPFACPFLLDSNLVDSAIQQFEREWPGQTATLISHTNTSFCGSHST